MTDEIEKVDEPEDSPKPEATQPKRRWLKYSLRLRFGIVLIVAAFIFGTVLQLYDGSLFSIRKITTEEPIYDFEGGPVETQVHSSGFYEILVNWDIAVPLLVIVLIGVLLVACRSRSS